MDNSTNMSTNQNANGLFHNSRTYCEAMGSLKLSNDPIVKPTYEEAASDFQNGIEEAYDYLLSLYDKKFKYNALKYNDEDVYQELSIVLFKCAKSYKTGKNANFNTFLWTSVQNKLGAYINAKRALKRTPQNGIVSLNTENNETGDEYIELQEDTSAEQELMNAEYNIYLQQYVFPRINDTDKMIITDILNGWTVTDIAEKRKVTTACIYSHLRHLRNNKKLISALYK